MSGPGDGPLERALPAIDAGLTDAHQRSSEPAYQLSAACWRCEAGAPAGAVGLCARCLSEVRNEAPDRSWGIDAGPHVDLHDRFVDAVAAFHLAVRRRNQYRSTFVHMEADRWCGVIAMGRARFAIDPPVLLRQGGEYAIVVDGDAGSATVTARPGGSPVE